MNAPVVSPPPFKQCLVQTSISTALCFKTAQHNLGSKKRREAKRCHVSASCLQSLCLKVPCLLEFRASGQGSSITVRKTIRCCVDCHNAFKASSRAWLGFGAFTQSALALLTGGLPVWRVGLQSALWLCCCVWDA